MYNIEKEGGHIIFNVYENEAPNNGKSRFNLFEHILWKSKIMIYTLPHMECVKKPDKKVKK